MVSLTTPRGFGMFAFNSNQTGAGRMVIIGGAGPSTSTSTSIEYLTSAGTTRLYQM